jgi:hypothetical protein
MGGGSVDPNLQAMMMVELTRLRAEVASLKDRSDELEE